MTALRKGEKAEDYKFRKIRTRHRRRVVAFLAIAVPKDVDADKFSTEFIQWLESKGYTFGGGIGPYKIIEDDV